MGSGSLATLRSGVPESFVTGAVSQWLGVTAGEDSFAETVFMKRRLIRAGAVSLTLWISSQARGQNSQPGSSNPSLPCAVSADDRALREIPERWREAYNEGNASRVAALYAEDAYYLTQHFVTGTLRGRAEIQAYVQRGVDAKYRIDSIEVLGTQCSGDFAYAITRYKSTNSGRNDVGVNLVVLRKREGQWMIVAHEAAMPDPAWAVQSPKER